MLATVRPVRVRDVVRRLLKTLVKVRRDIYLYAKLSVTS